MIEALEKQRKEISNESLKMHQEDSEDKLYDQIINNPYIDIEPE